MQTVITRTDYNFKDLKSKYEGKVRDVYTLNNNNIIVIATDRISAFDVIMPRGIKSVSYTHLTLPTKRIV